MLIRYILQLQRQQEMKNLQIAEQNYTNKVLQEDTVAKQQQIISLESLLVETRKVLYCIMLFLPYLLNLKYKNTPI